MGDRDLAKNMDMVSAACPHCHILLVEAKHSNSKTLLRQPKPPQNGKNPKPNEKLQRSATAMVDQRTRQNANQMAVLNISKRTTPPKSR